jgi:hypothetical protein
MRSIGIERRKHRREECVDCMDINVSLKDHNATIHGVCMNMSEEGFCVFTPMLLTKDQPIEFKENLEVSSKKAVVKWSHLYFQKFYKSGMMLTA